MKIYTDGACSPNPGNGGWGYVVVIDSKIVSEAFGREKNTTNNRMELMAVIKALEWVKAKRITVYSDSRYIVDAFNKGWVDTWITTGFKKGTIKNIDLWMRLLILNERVKPKWKWVKGHNGNEFNERADHLASFKQ